MRNAWFFPNSSSSSSHHHTIMPEDELDGVHLVFFRRQLEFIDMHGACVRVKSKLQRRIDGCLDSITPPPKEHLATL